MASDCRRRPDLMPPSPPPIASESGHAAHHKTPGRSTMLTSPDEPLVHGGFSGSEVIATATDGSGSEAMAAAAEARPALRSTSTPTCTPSRRRQNLPLPPHKLQPSNCSARSQNYQDVPMIKHKRSAKKFMSHVVQMAVNSPGIKLLLSSRIRSPIVTATDSPKATPTPPNSNAKRPNPNPNTTLDDIAGNVIGDEDNDDDDK